MPLGRIKALYCIAVMAIGILLAFFGGVVGWLAAVLVLSSALPAWKMVIENAEDRGADRALSVVQYQIRHQQTTSTTPAKHQDLLEAGEQSPKH